MDGMATVRALKRIRGAGFTLTVEDDRLVVEPLSSLSDAQQQFIRAHNVALVAWSGDVSQLSARLGVCEKALTARESVIHGFRGVRGVRGVSPQPRTETVRSVRKSIR